MAGGPARRDSKKALIGPRKLGVVSLALITYFNVSGGPWGSEPIIASCGPRIGILATLVFPFIWCLPLALSFAELFSAFPTDSSFCTWVSKAFGRGMGFQVGYWSWVGGVIDNAIYPCLMIDSICAVLFGPNVLAQSVVVPWWMYLTRLVAATIFMFPTLRSIDAVGRFLLLLAVTMTLPVVALFLYSLPLIDTKNWFLTRPDPNWSQLLSMLYWSYSGFDAAGAYASEIDQPRRTFPRAMVLVVLLVALTYSVPFFAATGVNKPPFETWDDGIYPVIAEQIAGPTLRSCFLVCAILGNMGVYAAKLTKNGFMLAGMADLAMAPSFFIQRSPATGVPVRAILLSYFIIAFMAAFDFNVILGVDNFLSSLTCVVELAAVARLRFTDPHLERPYRVNLSNRSLLGVLVLPITIGSFVVVNEFTKSRFSFTLNFGALICGLLGQRMLHRAKRQAITPRASKILERGFHTDPSATDVTAQEPPPQVFLA